MVGYCLFQYFGVVVIDREPWGSSMWIYQGARACEAWMELVDWSRDGEAMPHED